MSRRGEGPSEDQLMRDVAGVKDIPGTFCLVNFLTAYTPADPDLAHKLEGERNDDLCRSCNSRHGAVPGGSSPDIAALGLSLRCSPSVGRITNLAAYGQALTAATPSSKDYAFAQHAVQPMAVAFVMAPFKVGFDYAMPGLSWLTPVASFVHDLLYVDVCLGARRPSGGIVVWSWSWSTSLAWASRARGVTGRVYGLGVVLAAGMRLYFCLYTMKRGQSDWPYFAAILPHGLFLACLLSVTTYVSVYLQSLSAVMVAINTNAFAAKVLVKTDGAGKTTLVTFPAPQYWNLAPLFSTVACAGCTPGISQAQRGLITATSITTFAPGGVLMTAFSVNILVASMSLSCGYYSVNALMFFHKLSQSPVLLILVYFLSPWAHTLKRGAPALFLWVGSSLWRQVLSQPTLGQPSC